MSCDCEVAEVYNVMTRRARKAHDCDECGENIRGGETYRYVSGIFDREPFSFHLHGVCADWREAYGRHVREAQTAAVLIIRRFEGRHSSYVGNAPPVHPTIEEARHARAILNLCHCIEIGGLAEALRELGDAR